MTCPWWVRWSHRRLIALRDWLRPTVYVYHSETKTGVTITAEDWQAIEDAFSQVSKDFDRVFEVIDAAVKSVKAKK